MPRNTTNTNLIEMLHRIEALEQSTNDLTTVLNAMVRDYTQTFNCLIAALTTSEQVTREQFLVKASKILNTFNMSLVTAMGMQEQFEEELKELAKLGGDKPSQGIEDILKHMREIMARREGNKG